MDNIFYRVLLNDRVKIEPKFLSKNYREYVSNRLKKNVEGVCSKHGFVKPDSIEVYKIAPGNIELIGLDGSVIFDVYYYAEVCNPLVGNIIKATVTNVNKFGILAEVSGILEIIVAKNSVSIQHDHGILLDGIEIGHIIMVEVMAKKYELNDKKISIVGRLVSKESGSKTKKTVALLDVKDDDDEAVDDGNEEVENSEEEVENSEEEEEQEQEQEEELEIEDDDVDVFAERPVNEFFESDEEVEEPANPEYEFYSEDGDDFASDGSDQEEF